jgi:hypothetical protein
MALAVPRDAGITHAPVVHPLTSPRPRITAAFLPVVLFLVGFGLLLSRRPSMLAPHFYAEDGQTFFADAHNLPVLQALFSPAAGYWLLFQRLVAFVFAPLGLSGAALAYVLVAVAIQVGPAVFFTSSRFRHLVADDRARRLIAFLYILLSSDELTGRLTNSQWHLAVLALLVLLAAQPASRAAAVFDGAVLVLSGLTGPQALMLLPIAIVLHRSSLNRTRRWQIGVLAITATVQLGLIVAGLHSASRGHVPLGASAPLLPFIVANQLLGPLAGGYLPMSSPVSAVAVAAGVTVLLAYAGLRGPVGLRCLIGFAVALAAAGLVLPYSVGVAQGLSAWQTMTYGPPWFGRYFSLLPIAVVLSAVWLVGRSHIRIGRAIVGPAVIAALLCINAATHWEFPPDVAQPLAAYEQRLDHASPGTVVVFPIAPYPWYIRLVAR